MPRSNPRPSRPPSPPPIPRELERRYGRAAARALAGMQRIATYTRGVIVAVRAGQFRVQVGHGATWQIEGHVSGHGVERRTAVVHTEARPTLYACLAAEREREALRQSPMGLPCAVSREDGLLFVLPQNRSFVFYDGAREVEKGVVELDTQEGPKVRAYTLGERPRLLSPEPLEPDPGACVLRACDLPPVPDALVSRYLATEIRVFDEHRRPWALVPSAEPAPERLTWPFPWQLHVLTAWNPLCVPLSLAENRTRQGRLIKQIARRGLRYWGAIGAEPESSGATMIEESLLVADLTREEAVTLGREHHQHAVFELVGSRLRVLGSREGRMLGERLVVARVSDA